MFLAERRRRAASSRRRRGLARGAALVLLPLAAGWLTRAARAPRRRPTLWTIAWYFAEAGAFVFGSGLAIVPFLHGGVVDHFHWLDRAAVPRRGRGRDDHAGAGRHHRRVHRLPRRRAARARPWRRSACSCRATCSSIIPAPYFRRFADNRPIKAFVDGVTAAATGAIAGAAFVLGRRAIIDVPTVVDRGRDAGGARPVQEGARAARHPCRGPRGPDPRPRYLTSTISHMLLPSSSIGW